MSQKYLADVSVNYHDEMLGNVRTVGFDVLRRAARGQPAVLEVRDRWSLGLAGSGRRLADAYVLMFGRPGSLSRLECPRGWEGKRVLAVDRASYNVARAVAAGYRMGAAVAMDRADPVVWEHRSMLDRKLLDYDFGVASVVPGSLMVHLMDTNVLEVSGFGDIDMRRVGLFHPWAEAVRVDLRGVFQEAPNIRVLGEASNVIRTHSYRVGGPGDGGSVVVVEGFADDADPARYEYALPDFTSDERHRCFGKGVDYFECVRRRTNGGELKPEGVWDRKCEGDADCPFWDPRAGSAGSGGGGGCDIDSGFCEMPVGVKQLSFRGYHLDEDYHRPFCDCRDRLQGCCSGTSGPYMYGPGREPLRFDDAEDP